ncbi:unnamed protein product [Psylliodes chrysocephalus]|uniref:Uncharacterized protein n=1 Tax=Psylliodes chrysocephalus TaxID=3402493 RepID=A0A9P0CUH4_9CUCU|nr:unnamed protein product [Psylliodes chrysocephala]
MAAELPMTLELLENDPLQEANITSFYEQMKSTYRTLDYYKNFTFIITILLMSLLVMIDIFLIEIFRRHPKLKTKINQYIFHYVISHLLFIISKYLFFYIFILTGLVNYISTIVFYIMLIFSGFASGMCYMLGLGLGVEWLCIVYNKNLEGNVRFLYNYPIIISYLIGGVIYGILIILMFYSLHVGIAISKILDLLFILFILICNCLRYKRRHLDNKNNYILNIASILILIWVPAFIYEELMTWSYGHYTLYTILLFTSEIPELFAVSTPIVLVIILKSHDEYFRKVIDRRNLWTLKSFDGNSEDEDEMEYTVNSDTNIINV